jgi:two-component system, NarL family, invasion response regulator UvrY
MGSNQKQIIIADDHAVVRTGLQLILDETTDMRIVEEARNGDELLIKLRSAPFDLVILDISMPGKDALDVLKEIKSTLPLLPVVVFTMNPDEMYAIRMIRSGASAYINKETKPDQLIEILRTVLSGKRFFSQRQSELLAEAVTGPSTPEPHEMLTDREFQIMFMLAMGIKKNEIAEKLNLSKHTIGNHRNSIMKKMKTSTNSDLTRYAIQHGIIK